MATVQDRVSFYSLPGKVYQKILAYLSPSDITALRLASRALLRLPGIAQRRRHRPQHVERVRIKRICNNWCECTVLFDVCVRDRSIIKRYTMDTRFCPSSDIGETLTATCQEQSAQQPNVVIGHNFSENPRIAFGQIASRLFEQYAPKKLSIVNLSNAELDELQTTLKSVNLSIEQMSCESCFPGGNYLQLLLAQFDLVSVTFICDSMYTIRQLQYNEAVGTAQNVYFEHCSLPKEFAYDNFKKSAYQHMLLPPSIFHRGLNRDAFCPIKYEIPSDRKYLFHFDDDDFDKLCTAALQPSCFYVFGYVTVTLASILRQIERLKHGDSRVSFDFFVRTPLNFEKHGISIGAFKRLLAEQGGEIEVGNDWLLRCNAKDPKMRRRVKNTHVRVDRDGHSIPSGRGWPKGKLLNSAMKYSNPDTW